ncbi:MAG: helix-turn-helix domain-containing protein [Acutalibacteraceae bacterium]|jgi:transcriptional regulator with XRE-family HTH domain
MMFIYDLIEELCIKKNINITTMCRECNIPRSTLTDYKKGRIKSLSLDTLCKIADYFGVTVEYLCGAPLPAATEEALKIALFGEGVVVTDEMWNEVKSYAEYVKTKYQNKTNK